MPPLLIEATVVHHVLHSLNPHKGLGLGSFPRVVFKAIAPLLAQPLADSFNLSLASEERPDVWWTASV